MTNGSLTSGKIAFQELKAQRIELAARQASSVELGSMRQTMNNVLKLINCDTTSAHDLKTLIECDPPLTAKVLQSANCAFYACRTRISNIPEAIIWLGLDIIKEIAVKQKISEVFSESVVIGEYSRKKLWEHSVAVATLSKMIMRLEFGLPGDDIYSAALLHELGLLVMDFMYPVQLGEILRLSNENEARFEDIEIEIFGYTNSDLTEAVIRSWNFPAKIINTISYLQNPAMAINEDERHAAEILALSDHLCNHWDYGIGAKFSPLKSVIVRCFKSVGLTPHAVEVIMEDFKARMQQLREAKLI